MKKKFRVKIKGEKKRISVEVNLPRVQTLKGWAEFIEKERINLNAVIPQNGSVR